MFGPQPSELSWIPDQSSFVFPLDLVVSYRNLQVLVYGTLILPLPLPGDLRLFIYQSTEDFEHLWSKFCVHLSHILVYCYFLKMG